MMDRLTELLFEYAEMFHDNFPTAIVRCEEDEMIEILGKCIKNKKKYKIDFSDGKVY